VDRCRTVKGVHLPGCYGCANGGHAACTCERASRQTVESRYNDALRKIAAMGCADMSPAGYALREVIQIARLALDPTDGGVRGDV
jgi:hypothetical protein